MAPSLCLPFDVNDENLRKEFFGVQVISALGELSAASSARWGNMTPQQMVEHLIWALEVANGLVEVKCDVHPKLIGRLKGFLFDDTPTSHDFMNPLLKKGLPPDRFSSISEARQELNEQRELFLRAPEGDRARLRTHPIFGRLNHDEWERSQYKHFFHHLLQFGLLEERRGAGGRLFP